MDKLEWIREDLKEIKQDVKSVDNKLDRHMLTSKDEHVRLDKRLSKAEYKIYAITSVIATAVSYAARKLGL